MDWISYQSLGLRADWCTGRAAARGRAVRACRTSKGRPLLRATSSSASIPIMRKGSPFMVTDVGRALQLRVY